MSWNTKPGVMSSGHLTPVSSLVRRIASKLPPGPRVAVKAPRIPGLQKVRAPRSRFTDDDVVSAVVLWELGIRMVAIAQALGCNSNTVRQWVLGTNRRHLT